MKNLTVVSLAVLLAVIFPAGYSSAAELNVCSPDEVFEACDADMDGRITREEWYTIDIDRDDVITGEEWDRYKYKSEDKKTSPFQIRYYDVYGDETSGREEFLRNFRRLE